MQPDATPAITTKQQKAVLALLAQPGVDAAAAACNVNPSTLWRWMQEPTFREALLSARREAFRQATTRIAAACAGAVTTLDAICADASAPPSARVSAARVILERAAAAIELEDLAERVAALEQEWERETESK